MNNFFVRNALDDCRCDLSFCYISSADFLFFSFISSSFIMNRNGIDFRMVFKMMSVLVVLKMGLEGDLFETGKIITKAVD